MPHSNLVLLNVNLRAILLVRLPPLLLRLFLKGDSESPILCSRKSTADHINL